MPVQATLTTVISIFLLLMLGYGAKKAGVLKEGDVGVVNSILINLTMPAFIFVYTHGQPLTTAMIKVPFLGFVMEMVIVCVAYLIAIPFSIRGYAKVKRLRATATTGGRPLAG